jgi:PKHD-type hydroxylase
MNNITYTEDDLKYSWSLKSYNYRNLVILDDVFNVSELQELKRLCSSLVLKKGEIRDNQFSESLKDTGVRDSEISFLPSSQPRFEMVFRKVVDAVLYANSTYFNFDIHTLESLQYAEYKSTSHGFYRKHIDSYTGQGYGVRKLSFTLQLSDEQEYEGGEVCLYTQHDPIIVPKKIGTIAIFPSYTLHEVKPVTSGVRKSLVAWVMGAEFK